MPSKARKNGAPSPYNDPEYLRNRRVILAGNPPCHLCGRPGADSVDHIVPLQNGGAHNLDNLRPAHRSCNSRAGNRARQANDHARLAARAEAMRDTGIPIPDFLGSSPLPPSQLSSLSTANRSEPVGHGHDRPRLETIVRDDVESRANEIGALAKSALGVELMPWQLRALHGMTALKADGKFLHRSGLVSTARQNGKTTALSAAVLWMLTTEAARRGPVTVLTTAHRLDVAVELFHRLAEILEVQYGAKITRAYGRNEVRMPDGSRWLIKAATGSVGHGLSCDFVIADEIWDIPGEAMDQGLVPTMRARPNPLLMMWSTAGTEGSHVFRRYREQGLRQIDQGETGRFYFAEWSPPPDLDPMTPAAWEYANPALGTTLELDTLQAEAESPDRAAFFRSSVNLWIASDRGWIPPGTWTQLEYGGDVPPGGVIAIESSIDDSAYFGVRCVALPSGATVATVAFHVDSTRQLIECVEELAAGTTTKFAVSPTIDLHFPRWLDNRKVVVGYGELQKWTQAIRQMILEGRLVHTGETMLAEHVQRAVAVKVSASLVLSSQRSPGPIELARCMVWAAALASRSTTSGKPMIVVAGG